MLHLASWYPGKPDADRILRVIDDEVARVAAGVETEELDRFRSGYLADYLGSIDSLSQRGMLVAATEQQRANAELINEIPAALARVQPEDVTRIASEWLRPDRRAVVDLHPGAK
jgi:predicted Zn-dependent peptidase